MASTTRHTVEFSKNRRASLTHPCGLRDRRLPFQSTRVPGPLCRRSRRLACLKPYQSFQTVFPGCCFPFRHPKPYQAFRAALSASIPAGEPSCLVQHERRRAEAATDPAGVCCSRDQPPGSIRGVRSSLSGNSEDTTRPPARRQTGSAGRIRTAQGSVVSAAVATRNPVPVSATTHDMPSVPLVHV